MQIKTLTKGVPDQWPWATWTFFALFIVIGGIAGYILNVIT